MPVDWEGDVTPSTSTDFPVLPGTLDTDNDNVPNLLSDDGGNFLYTDDLSPTDPEGASMDGDAWDCVKTWRRWAFVFAVIVGDTARGSLSIFSQATLRITNLTIGNAVGSHGFVGVGSNSLFSNDRDAFPYSVRQIISQAKGGSVDPEDVVYSMLGDPAHPYSTFDKVEQPAGNYNVWVGKRGTGILNVDSFCAFEVRHQLIVGGYYAGEEEDGALTAGEAGIVKISGTNSILYGHGKFLADTEDPATVTAAPPLQVTTAGTVILSQGTLYNRTGIVNAGIIDVLGEFKEHSTISAGEWVEDSETIVGELVNTGLIRVRAGGTLKITCPLTNSGEIIIDEGGTIDFAGGVLVRGLIRYSKCGDAPVEIDTGVITIPDDRVADMVA